MYRHDGNACAIGCLVDDKDVVHLDLYDNLEALRFGEISEFDYNLLCAMQDWHDTSGDETTARWLVDQLLAP